MSQHDSFSNSGQEAWRLESRVLEASLSEQEELLLTATEYQDALLQQEAQLTRSKIHFGITALGTLVAAGELTQNHKLRAIGTIVLVGVNMALTRRNRYSRSAAEERVKRMEDEEDSFAIDFV